MSAAFGEGWGSKELLVDSLRLDVNNPRLDIKANSSQEQVRKALLATEEVFELIQQIHSRQGLLAGERIIVTKEGGDWVVLEGNRRTAAIQIIRDPNLLTKLQQKRLPQISPELKKQLRSIPSDIAPSREAAEPILTKRHTERGAKPWSTLANMRRVYRYFENGKGVDEICEVLAISKARVTQLVRGYRLFKLAQDSSGWSDDEGKVLQDPKLVTSAFTRFFTLRDVRVKLGLDYDDQQKPSSTQGEAALKKNVALIARRFFFSKDVATGKPQFDTRSTPEELFNGTPRRGDIAKPTSQPKVQTPKASKFFEKIECKANDDSLISLCNELKQIDPARMPIAASMLLRSVFECSLVYQIKKKKLWGEFVKSKAGKDPTLAELMQFGAAKANPVFNETRVADMLSSGTATEAKKYLDIVTHGRWTDADPTKLISIGNGIRKVITAIVEDTQ